MPYVCLIYIVYVVEYPAAAKLLLAVPTPVVSFATTPVLLTKLRHMKISYAITVCNEFKEIQRLVHFLLQHKRIQDNIVILFDEANGDLEVENFLRTHSQNGEFHWHKGKFDRHFADWKNKLSSFCNGDYIFQIDALS